MDAPVSLPGCPKVGVNQHSPAEAKIALFRSLFRGREDVYPRRFESPYRGPPPLRSAAFAGYSPACVDPRPPPLGGEGDPPPAFSPAGAGRVRGLPACGNECFTRCKG